MSWPTLMMFITKLPVLSNLACRLLVEVLVRAAGVKELSVPVPVPRRSAPTVVPQEVMMMMFITIFAGD